MKMALVGPTATDKDVDHYVSTHRGPGGGTGEVAPDPVSPYLPMGRKPIREHRRRQILEALYRCL
jgi:hypothetical protein